MNANLLLFVLTLIARFFAPRHNVQLRFMRAQLRILRNRITADRIVPTPEEKAELIRIGALMDHDIAGLMSIVRPKTYRRWLREQRQGKPFRKLGRPPAARELRELIVRMARANIAWGYRRIAGELKKLGIAIGATTIRDVLKASGMHPAPDKADKKPPLPWTTFVHAHMESLVATDFFTKRIYTWRGVFDAYVLVFIHLGTRQVYCSPATFSPNEDWVMQQARNASVWLEDIGITPRFLILDRDTKYTRKFRRFWKDDGVRCIRIPPQSPRANAFAEAYIGRFKHSCLNHFCCLSLAQLDYIVRVWLEYYHVQRPHQGKDIGNTVLNPGFVPSNEGAIRRHERLGGIIAWYERDAA